MRLTLLALPLALAACEMTPVNTPPAEDLASCGGDAQLDLIGATRAYAASRLATRVDDGSARLLEPDSIITMDYRADRLNVELDGDGIVTGVKCG
ncbi:I78 family peptidase inhibitor [Pseudoroseicyclus sp. H15]